MVYQVFFGIPEFGLGPHIEPSCRILTKDTIIVGNGYAGLADVARLREGGHPGRIFLVGDDPHAPYQRPPLSRAHLLAKTGRESLFSRADDYFPSHGTDISSLLSP